MSAADPLLDAALLTRLEALELVSRKVFRGRLQGERRGLRKGQGVEFADFRNYAAGDDLRFVDWNTYARLDRLFLKLFLEEEEVRFYGLLDASRSMSFGAPAKFRYGKQLLAALAYIGLARGARVKLEAFGADDSPAFRGRRSLWPMLEWLERLPLAPSAPLADAMRSFCTRNAGKGIVVIVSDFLEKDGYESALRRVAAERFDVYAVQILSAEELAPTLDGDLRLVDCEDGQQVEVTAAAALTTQYRQTLDAYTAALRAFCLQRGVSFALASNATPVAELVLDCLRRGGLVR